MAASFRISRFVVIEYLNRERGILRMRKTRPQPAVYDVTCLSVELRWSSGFRLRILALQTCNSYRSYGPAVANHLVTNNCTR